MKLERSDAIPNEANHPDEPMRTCIACNEAFPKRMLLRFVLSPEGEVLLDYRGKLAGRGAYLFANRACFDEAYRKKSFKRGFKTDKAAFDPDRLWGLLRSANEARIKELLYLARKANALHSGTNTIELVLKKEKMALFLLAEDVSENTLKRFEALAKAATTPLFQALSSETLGVALGKPSRSTIGVTHPSFALKLARELDIYNGIVNRKVCCLSKRNRA